MTQAQSKSYGGVKKKLMGAICMLLVASIMVVSSTYAWFTLSTAPEITGISTSVGANGNLEMALLNGSENGTTDTDTYADLAKIKSAVGDSVAATSDAKKSNITWGNLVDLSKGYGLDQIKLMPARLNITGDNKVLTTSLLKTATYGSDGRVKDVSTDTVAAANSGVDGFVYDTTNPTYGVRAIGVSSNLSGRQIIFSNARSAVTSAVNSAGAAFANAAAKNLLKLALAAQSTEENYTVADIQAMQEVATGAKTSLENIVKAYAQAALAKAASKGSAVTEDQLATLQLAAANLTSATILQTAMTTAGLGEVANLTALATAQKSVDDAITALNAAAEADGNKSVDAIKESVIKPLIGGSEGVKAYDKDGGDVAISTENLPNVKSIYLSGGVAKAISDETGLLKLGEISGIEAYAGTKGSTDTAGLVTLKGTVDQLESPEGNSKVTISDTYGYALDMAFRTNAASSNLLLASKGVQRVYADSKNQDTMGNGSTMTFEAGNGMKPESVPELMAAVRVAFITDDGTIAGIASLDGITKNDQAGGTAQASWSGTLKLKNYQVEENTGVLKLTDAGANTQLMALTQNTATKLTVVVWLDGDAVNNSMVVNGVESMTGSMNLQFSSDATLQPMLNSALKNGTGTGGAGEDVAP